MSTPSLKVRMRVDKFMFRLKADSVGGVVSPMKFVTCVALVSVMAITSTIWISSIASARIVR